MNRQILLRSIILAAIAACVIFFRYTSMPADLTRDEIEFARFAVKLSAQPYAPYDSYATGHATPYFYVLLGSFKLLGLSQLALRLPAAILGVLGVIALYLVLNQLWGSSPIKLKTPFQNKDVHVDMAFITAAIFATTRWYYIFARYSFEATFIILLELVSLAAIIRFVQKKHMLWLIVSAVFAGLAYNSYQPGRLFIIIPFITLLIFPAVRSLKNIFIYLLICGCLMLPLTLYISQHKDVRIQQQLYFADKNLSASEKATFLLQNTTHTIGMFFWKGDVSGRHNYPYKPSLTLIAAFFSIIGLVVSLRQFRSGYNSVFLIYFFLALIPTLLTYPHENPNMLRTITVLPALMYFLGLGVRTLAHFFQEAHQTKRYSSYIVTGLLLLLIGSAYQDARTYFIFQKQVFEEAFEIKDGFAGVYVFMHERSIPVEQFRLSAEEMEVYNKVAR